MEPALKQKIDTIPARVCGWMDVDLRAISHNLSVLKGHVPTAQVSAVVKADAYGLGLTPVAEHLHAQGVDTLFVAYLEEALALRKTLSDVEICVLTGCLSQTEAEFFDHNLTPVINDYDMLERWANYGKKVSKNLPALLHVDTGMNRIGFDCADFAKLTESMGILSGLDLKGIMSHLACSPEAYHPQNEAQRSLFEDISKFFPGVPQSLADTAGIYLGPDYHYDRVRPGKGLFGLFQAPRGEELQQAVTLNARIIQVREVKQGELVGYGAQAHMKRDSILATLGIGYADGLDRRAGNAGHALISDHKAHMVGTLSMDYTVVDITDLPASACQVGDWAQITGPDLPLEEMASDFGTISRELSTRLGSRLYKTYRQ